MINKKERRNHPAVMELEPIKKEGDVFPKRRVAFELILAVALSAGCWYTYF